MSEKNTCNHNNCSCPTDGDSEYCSTQCQSSTEQDLIELKCDCGHPGCSA